MVKEKKMKAVLSIAGSDSSGGAGIQADIKTITMNGVYAMSAITALTAQNTLGVRAISEVTPEFLKEQIDAVFEDIFPDSVKIGMVSSKELIDVIADRLKYLRNLDEEKAKVEKVITEQGKWTDELATALAEAMTLTEVEDIYRPYKPKRKTRASVAIAKGLEPLADILQAQSKNYVVAVEAEKFVTEEVPTVEDAIAGAKDIIAERISDSADLRKELRELIVAKGFVVCSLVENENNLTYETYANFKQEVKNLPSHRVLAINRSESEKCLKVDVVIDEKLTTPVIEKHFKKNNEDTNALMDEVIADAYDRLLFPSLERECRNNLTDVANEQAIKMFEVNLKPLLLESPLKNNIILGFDPGYHNGCKIAVIDKNGSVLDTTVVYPTPPRSKTEDALEKLKAMIEKHNVDIIAIGNGTASKESEIFVAELIKHVNHPVSYAVISEAGASVYSASKLAAEEFPDYDVNLRSAVSIARRLQDPLAELIKIDVKSIGVGQYQHDMPQNRLTEVLTGVVEDCVNSVGVDLNTASVLKDDKGYHYIKITGGDWPNIYASFDNNDKSAEYIGPFLSGYVANETIDRVKKKFKLPSCGKVFPRDISRNSRPCLNFHIKNCSAPCAKKISQKDYKESVTKAIKFLKTGEYIDSDC